MQHLNFFMSVGEPMHGYGKLEIAIWREMHRAGVSITPFGRYTKRVLDALPDDVRDCVLQRPARQIADITLATRQVFEVSDWSLRTTRLWLYTMAESDKIRPSFVDAINQRCERVLVPSPPLVEVYQASGVTVPVHYVPFGVDFVEVQPAQRSVNGQFRWLGYSLAGQRKGADRTVMAHAIAFNKRPDVQLWLKTRAHQHSWLAGLTDDDIVTLPGWISEAAWYELLGDVHAFVFPSRGEGIGLPPREAALAGLPVIAPAFLGLWDIDQWGYPVKIQRMRPVQYSMTTVNADDARWADADTGNLAERMAWITDNYAEACEKARAGREYLLSNFTWRRTAQSIIELLERYG